VVTRGAFAEQLAPAYAANPHIVAVFAGGSTARGHADRFSDLEVGVVWDRPPTDAERAEAIVKAEGDLVRLYPAEEYGLGPVWADAWKIGRLDGAPLTGVEVDLHHFLVERVETVLAAVLDDFDPEVEKQSLVGAIATGIPLHGHDLLERWRQRAAVYPDGLRLAVVRANAQIEGLWRLDAFAARDNPVAGYAVLTAAHEQLLRTLLGLNRTYYSGVKSLDAVTARLELTPRNLLERLRASYPLRPGQSKEILAALVEETYDLIETHLPKIDVGRLRAFLRYERPLWDE
jgi:predicted nucleotidyltransferase